VHRLKGLFLSLLLAFILHPSPAAASSQAIADRLKAAAELASLDAPGLAPWHMKVDVTFYDLSGKNPYSGTIETWHTGEDHRTTITVGSTIETTLSSGGKWFLAGTGSDIPALADLMLAALLHPGPSPEDVENAALELRKESFGKNKLECVMLAQPMRNASTMPIGLFPAYCLDPGTDDLRASYNIGSVTVLRNALGKFQGKKVATAITLMDGQVRIAEARVSTLQTFTPADQFKPDPGMKASAAPTVIGMMSDRLLTKIDVTYPLSARQNHTAGTVVLNATIGRDGHIHSLRLVSAPSVDLALSAISAVRQWTYRPYLIDGEPVKVSTTITVNYNMTVSPL
jgi:TonB family protein